MAMNAPFAGRCGTRLCGPACLNASSVLPRRWHPSGVPAFVLLALAAIDLTHLQAAGAADDEAIRRIRTGTLIIEAAPDVEVSVQQLRHEFWFGAALANQAFNGRMNAQDAARYREVFLTNFNAAVTENALKWPDMERTPGRVNHSTVEAILEWTDQNRIPLRGHNIFWGVPRWVPPWLKAMDDTALRQALEKRATEIGRHYRSRFAEYDLNNEMLHGNYYEERLGPGITRDMASWVLREDPEAVLYLNDYDILTGNRLDDFIAHIQRLRETGVPIHGIGVQGHLHDDSFDAAALRHALDRLAWFQLPIRVTEFNFPGQRSRHYGKRGARLTDGEEQAKATAMASYFRICFAHPAVEGILLWGFWEGANWIPVSSLYRRDWTPTPAAHAYRDLVFNEWWTQWQGRTDANGRCVLRAFFGKHRVDAGSRSVVVELKRARGMEHIALRD
jgi:GH35 family endo-1,4-beta-xylanase